jgi:soluble lytic murein transglycosylase
MQHGDYASAVQTFQAVLNDSFIDDALRAEAAFRLGQAARREGFFPEAVNSLSQFIQNYPDDPRIPQAHFLRGDAYLGLGDWSRAIPDFERYLALKPGVIDSYAYERIGDAYLNLGQPDQALAAYDSATQYARLLPAKMALREKLAAGYINLGDLNDAIAQYDAILSEARNGGYRANIELQAARLELQLGLTEQGYARMQGLIDLYPTTSAAYTAMTELVSIGAPVDLWLIAQIAYANSDYTLALDTLNRYTTTTPVAPVEALLMLGRSYRELGNFPAAYTTFQTILDQYTNDPSFGLAWMEQGQTLYLENDYASAANRYLELATTNPQLPEAPRALWWAGYLFAQLGDTERALTTFELLGSSYPQAEQAQEGLLLAGTLAYNAGQTVRAQSIYTQLANNGTGSFQAQAFLWLGRLYQQAGQLDLAQQSYLGAAQAAPGDYFSIRGDDIRNNRAPFQAPASLQFEFDEGQEQAEAEAWLRQTFPSITAEGPLYPLNATLEGDPRMIRGRELWELADFAAARDEFESLREAYENDPLATYQLAVYFAQIGLYRSSIFAAADLIIASGATDFTAPRYLVRLRYPIHFQELVLPATEEWGVDPLLVFSLIRQESLYESFATSSAQAQGLMQIIPSTGAEINQRISWSPNYQNSDLYRPYINVHFGVYYLSWVLDLVENQPYAALAGYNGGPGNAMEWLSLSGQDIDLFIQTVAFDETKLYVERIYEQYTIYRYLYGVG